MKFALSLFALLAPVAFCSFSNRVGAPPPAYAGFWKNTQWIEVTRSKINLAMNQLDGRDMVGPAACQYMFGRRYTDYYSACSGDTLLAVCDKANPANPIYIQVDCKGCKNNRDDRSGAQTATCEPIPRSHPNKEMVKRSHDGYGGSATDTTASDAPGDTNGSSGR